jgi:hypothetical protein
MYIPQQLKLGRSKLLLLILECKHSPKQGYDREGELMRPL